MCRQIKPAQSYVLLVFANRVFLLPFISLAGSSRKNESDNSESFGSFSLGKGLNSLNVNSFDDSSQLSTETQSSVRTGKSVAVGNKIY